MLKLTFRSDLQQLEVIQREPEQNQLHEVVRALPTRPSDAPPAAVGAAEKESILGLSEQIESHSVDSSGDTLNAKTKLYYCGDVISESLTFAS